MKKTVKVVIACATGMATSTMAATKLTRELAKRGVDAKVTKGNITDLAALTETILQQQVAQALKDAGLGFLAQQVPPVLFHSTPLPTALIVSPRDVIRQDGNLSLLADLSLEGISRLEDEVADYMDASTLVEDVGGR